DVVDVTPAQAVPVQGTVPSFISKERDGAQFIPMLWVPAFAGMTAWVFLLLAIPSRLSATDANEANLYRDSIRSTKQSIARETLGALYHDALDYYHDDRYDDALQLLDKIYSIDPHYEDVGKLRETIRRKQASRQSESTMDGVREQMRKGEGASR